MIAKQQTGRKSGSQPAPRLAKPSRRRYGAPATVNPVAGRENPNNLRRTSAPKTIAGAFFVPAVTLYGGCAWAGFGLAGFLGCRFLTPRTVRHHLPRENGGDGSTTQGAVPMKQDPARNPSALRERASAHRAMALAALRADSSLSTRLSRYNHHMSVARALEADAAQHDLRTPTASKARHADLLNLRAHLRHMRATAALEVLGGVQP